MKIQHRVLAVFALIAAAALLTLVTATPAYAMSKGDPAYDVIVMALTVYMIVSPIVIVILIVLLVRANKKAKEASSEPILPSAQRAQTTMPQSSPYDDDPYAGFDAAPAPKQAPTARQQQAAAQRHRPAQGSSHGRISESQPQKAQAQQAQPTTAQQQAKMRQAQAQRQAQARAAQQGQARPRVRIDPNGAGGQHRQ